jgi:hypothetical protein
MNLILQLQRRKEFNLWCGSRGNAHRYALKMFPIYRERVFKYWLRSKGF